MRRYDKNSWQAWNTGGCWTLRQLLVQSKDPLPNPLRRCVLSWLQRMQRLLHWGNQENQQSGMREHQGAVRRRGTTSLTWMYITKTVHHFDSEHAKAIDHGCFKGERLVKEALHSGPQPVNLCVLLPVQYQEIQTRASHRKHGHTHRRTKHHRRTKLHKTNHACKGTGNGRGGTSTKQPPLLINRLRDLNLALSFFNSP